MKQRILRLSVLGLLVFAACAPKAAECPVCEVCEPCEVVQSEEETADQTMEEEQIEYQYISLAGSLLKINPQSGEWTEVMTSTSPELVDEYNTSIIIKDLQEGSVGIYDAENIETSTYTISGLAEVSLHGDYLVLESPDDLVVVNLIDLQDISFNEYIFSGEHLLDYIPNKTGVVVNTPVKVYDLWEEFIVEFEVPNVVSEIITTEDYVFVFRFEAKNSIFIYDVNSGETISEDIFFDDGVETYEILDTNLLKVISGGEEYTILVWGSGAEVLGPGEVTLFSD